MRYPELKLIIEASLEIVVELNRLKNLCKKYNKLDFI